MRSSVGPLEESAIGSAPLLLLRQRIASPLTNPMMGLVLEGWFLLAHLLFSRAVGIVVAGAYHRSGVLETLP